MVQQEREGAAFKLQPGDPLCSMFDCLNRTCRHTKLSSRNYDLHFKEGEKKEGKGEGGESRRKHRRNSMKREAVVNLLDVGGRFM